jgi:hypothetical protein
MDGPCPWLARGAFWLMKNVDMATVSISSSAEPKSIPKLDRSLEAHYFEH